VKNIFFLFQHLKHDFEPVEIQVWPIVLLYCFYNPSRVLRGFGWFSAGTLEELSKNSAETCELRQNYIRTNTGKYSFLCIFDPEINLSQLVTIL
jgi:hypothetical protein